MYYLLDYEKSEPTSSSPPVQTKRKIKRYSSWEYEVENERL